MQGHSGSSGFWLALEGLTHGGFNLEFVGVTNALLGSRVEMAKTVARVLAKRLQVRMALATFFLSVALQL